MKEESVDIQGKDQLIINEEKNSESKNQDLNLLNIEKGNTDGEDKSSKKIMTKDLENCLFLPVLSEEGKNIKNNSKSEQKEENEFIVNSQVEQSLMQPNIKLDEDIMNQDKNDEKQNYLNKEESQKIESFVEDKNEDKNSKKDYLERTEENKINHTSVLNNPNNSLKAPSLILKQEKFDDNSNNISDQLKDQTNQTLLNDLNISKEECLNNNFKSNSNNNNMEGISQVIQNSQIISEPAIDVQSKGNNYENIISEKSNKLDDKRILENINLSNNEKNPEKNYTIKNHAEIKNAEIRACSAPNRNIEIRSELIQSKSFKEFKLFYDSENYLGKTFEKSKIIENLSENEKKKEDRNSKLENNDFNPFHFSAKFDRLNKELNLKNENGINKGRIIPENRTLLSIYTKKSGVIPRQFDNEVFEKNDLDNLNSSMHTESKDFFKKNIGKNEIDESIILNTTIQRSNNPFNIPKLNSKNNEKSKPDTNILSKEINRKSAFQFSINNIVRPLDNSQLVRNENEKMNEINLKLHDYNDGILDIQGKNPIELLSIKNFKDIEEKTVIGNRTKDIFMNPTTEKPGHLQKKQGIKSIINLNEVKENNFLKISENRESINELKKQERDNQSQIISKNNDLKQNKPHFCIK